MLIIVLEHHGVYEAAHQCLNNECSGLCSNTIYHCGCIQFTTIFILRQHNHYIHPSRVFRQQTTNSCSHRHYHLQSGRLKELRCIILLLKAIVGGENLMVYYVKHISKKRNWSVKMDTTPRSFPTYSTNNWCDIFAIFHHASKCSMMWSSCHNVSKTGLVI